MKKQIVIASPVTHGDWIEVLAGLLDLPNDSLAIAAWALGLEPKDVARLLREAKNIIAEEDVYFFGNELTIRLESAFNRLVRR